MVSEQRELHVFSLIHTFQDDHPHFLSLARKLADALRNTIFVDQVIYTYSQKQEILDLLEEHITENLVKVT